MKKVSFFIVFLITNINNLSAQRSSADSLLLQLKLETVGVPIAPVGGADSLLLQLKSDETTETQYKIYNNLFWHYVQIGQINSMGICSRKLIQLASETKSDSLQAMAFVEFGIYFWYAGNYLQALEFSFKGLAKAQEINSAFMIAFASQIIGSTYKYLKNYPEALRYLKKGEEKIISLNLTKGPLYNRTCKVIAETYLEMMKTDSALYYIQLANQVLLDRDNYGRALTLYVMGQVYEQKKDFDLAESFYKKSMSLSDSMQMAFPYVTATTNYANLLMTKGLLDPAKGYAVNSIKKCEYIGRKPEIIKLASILENIYNRQQNKDSAYFYVVLKDRYRDSLFNDQQLNQIQNLTFLQLLHQREQNAEQESQKLERKHNLQYVAIGIVLITFIIVFLALSRSIIVKTKFIEFFSVLGLLAVFEFINLYIHPYLAHATNDSPVLMLLVLIGIGAMLVPLHHKLEKWITEIMVEKNKKIRLAAAKKTIEQLENKTG